MPVAKTSAPKAEEKKDLLPVGKIVSIVSGGRTLQNYEVLEKDEKFVLFLGNPLNAPQTEYVLIPYEKIEAIGFGRE